MKRQNAFCLWAISSLLIVPASPLLAADDAAGIKLEPPTKPTKNRFGVSYRMGLNIEAKFKNIGETRPPGAGPGPDMGGQVDRFYDDGYNRVDVSGNTGNETWFWGYKNPSQVQDGTLVMHSTSARGGSPDDFTDDPQHGFELTYNREIGYLGKSKSTWGFEGGFGWMNIDIKDSRRLTGLSKTLADAFDIPGDVETDVEPNSAEYPEHDGSFLGPVPGVPGTFPIIGSFPARTITKDPNGAVITGDRVFEANLFSFRVGPYVDIPIAEKWTISFSAGVAAALIDGDFDFDQQVTTIGGTTRQTGSGSNTEVLFGGYASASIRYAINEQWGVFVSGQYMGMADCYTASAGRQEIELDFSKAAFVSAGVSFSF